MTIKDIAKLSGYGIGTVSRVINNQPGVSEKTKEKILKVIEESNFEPNENARFLKRKVGSSIGIIIKGTNNFLFFELLEPIQTNFLKLGEEISVQYVDEDEDEVENALQLIRERSPKGIMFLGADLDNFDERIDQIEVPCIVVTNDAKALKKKNLSSVSIDDLDSTYQMISYLIEKGHTKIGLVGGRLGHSQTTHKRYLGYKKAFESKGLECSLDANYKPCKYSIEAGYQATKQLLSEQKDLTAICCMSDTIAIGAIRAANDLKLRVPEDISITGFDGIEMTKFCVPRLTTIEQDAETIASRSVNILLKHMHYELEAEHESASFQLVERESVKSIK